MRVSTGLASWMVATLCTGSLAMLPEPFVGTPDGINLHVNSSTAGKVLVNGADVLSLVQQLQYTVRAQAALIGNLTDRVAILELTQSPTISPSVSPSVAPTSSSPSIAPTSSSPTTAVPSVAPSVHIPDGSRADPGATCFTLWIAQMAQGTLADGSYWVDPDGRGGVNPAQVACDMTGGGFQIVNTERVVDVGTRHTRRATVFTTSNFGADSAHYRFGRVQAEYAFAGELDDAQNYVQSYFNNALVSRWRNGLCNSGPVVAQGWPLTRTVNRSSFELAATPEGDVDVGCGSIPSYGRNFFRVRKIQLVPL